MMTTGKQVRGLRRLGWSLAALLLAALGGTGCNTYSYFDVHVTLNDSFSTPRRGAMHECHLYVTGAATADGVIGNCMQPSTNDIGHFDFSTYAESGAVTFTIKVYKGLGGVDQIGEGTTTMNVSSGNTAKGDLIINYTGMDPAN